MADSIAYGSGIGRGSIDNYISDIDPQFRLMLYNNHGKLDDNGNGFMENFAQFSDSDQKRFIDSVAAARNKQKSVYDALGGHNYAGDNNNNPYTNGSTSNPVQSGTGGTSGTDNNYGVGSTNTFDNTGSLYSTAKDLSQLHIDQTKDLMGAASGYRQKEADQNSDLRMRESNQNYGFQTGLHTLDNNFKLGYQQNQFGQDNTMASNQQKYRLDTLGDARTAAQSLWNQGANSKF